ncbi:hypothetical protein EV643_102416 [Kribbella sp. VKM Ac-2527]|uniref:Uncharacterized protein n=1 Tax=Kribbella caucasensis TaxID=2512215 RepID=A0A4R6KLY6_9ACTN|nr:hypothetical protein [Kribbella sp. VKM Ac-2527]TDO52577.1 hypothetical protein EV643_102416 [Kribbella sp. VKM Ac-2527]
MAAVAVDEVTIGWADATHTKIRVTWTETAPVANTLRLEVGWWEEPLPLGSVAATAPNEALINTSYLGYKTSNESAQIVVADPAGNEARSVSFDRYLRQGSAPNLALAPDRSLRWTLPAEQPDTTPNDPLDLAGTTKYTPRLVLDMQPRVVGDCGELRLPTTSEDSGLIPEQGKPSDVTIGTANEWNPRGASDEFGGTIATTGLTVTGPSSTPYGSALQLTGEVRYRYITMNAADVCKETSYLLPNEPLVLQGRNSSTSPWYVVGNLKTDVYGRYTATVKNPGGREYRVVRPDTSWINGFQYGAAASLTVRATTRLVSAKFVQPVISLGTRPQAYLWVDPAGTQKAALQFKNASGAWQGLTYKTLYAGRGLVSFPWNRRGSVQFRWWVPGSTTSTGLVVDPVYSSPFSLTVR